MAEKIFVTNPGSTSTKVALFDGDTLVFSQNVKHDSDVLAQYAKVIDQLEYRVSVIDRELVRAGISLEGLDAAVSQGGGIFPCKSGTYLVEPLLLEHQRIGAEGGQHPANLGGAMSKLYADCYGGQAYVVDPPTMDELWLPARVTGFSNVLRKSRCHALNIKEVARRTAAELNKPYEECRLVIVHMGGGISVAAQAEGRIVDAMDCLMGDGAFAATRAGGIPAGEVIRQCYSGEYTQRDMMDRLFKRGGLVEHLGTSDLLEVMERVDQGDRYAGLIYEAMIYQVAKQVGAYAASLSFRVDAVALTGGMIKSADLVEKLERMIGRLAPVYKYPGEFEMEAMCNGALRVLRGEEQAVHYAGKTQGDTLRDFLN
ncbi:MAG: butyrate kinase [Oscillospiraceae bacterium]